MAINNCRSDPWNFQKLWVSDGREHHDFVSMFNFLKDADDKNYVMSAAIYGDEMEKARADGLIERHAYSLIQVYNDEENNIKLVQLRNPWGDDHEWNGDWCDASHKWADFPSVSQALNPDHSSDGLFWMAWDDFMAIFDDVQICAMTMETPRAKFN